MPELKPSRWVIYFRDWSEEKAREYKPAFQRVENLVKPYRDALSGQIHQDCYWKFWDLRPQLMIELEKRSSILASAITSKFISFRFISAKYILNKQTKLYFFNTWAEFSCLQSSIHIEWASWTCGFMGGARRYSTSEALETWPMPDGVNFERLEVLGRNYHEFREKLLLHRQIGLTQLYNLFHDPSEFDAEIEEMRSLHRQLDQAVALAYGWDDLSLGHDFQNVPSLAESDAIRYTVSESTRIELLRRISTLNHERYKKEQQADTETRAISRSNRRINKSASPANLGDLFDGESA